MGKRRAIKLESETRPQLAGGRDHRQGDMASGRRGGSRAPERDQTEAGREPVRQGWQALLARWASGRERKISMEVF